MKNDKAAYFNGKSAKEDFDPEGFKIEIDNGGWDNPTDGNSGLGRKDEIIKKPYIPDADQEAQHPSRPQIGGINDQLREEVVPVTNTPEPAAKKQEKRPPMMPLSIKRAPMWPPGRGQS